MRDAHSMADDLNQRYGGMHAFRRLDMFGHPKLTNR